MRRREFITLLGGAAATMPLAVKAQQSDQRRRIGVLTALAEDDPENQARLAGFRNGLKRRGWSEDRNVSVDYRFAPAGSPDQAERFAKELVALQPDVILAQTTPVVTALQRETRTIPIVFASIADPLGSGFIASLPHPGGNIVMLYEPSVVGKWLSMLKEIAPLLARAAFIINPATATYYNYYLRAAEAPSRALGIDLVPTLVANTAEIERAIEVFASVPNGGLVVPPDVTTTAHRNLIVALAAQHHLPAVYTIRPFITAGGLMSYGVNFTDMFRQAAAYVDRILRGDNPADLPVQAATRFETIVNLKTAKALGLTVPPGLLVAADEVIE
jgi:putative tryptophan/tyrosine transport system substrate-binding protein